VGVGAWLGLQVESMTPEEKELERFLDALTAPIAGWRMARGVSNKYLPAQQLQGRMYESGMTRRKNALAEIHRLIMDYKGSE
jgi:hypothetical protein